MKKTKWQVLNNLPLTCFNVGRSWWDIVQSRWVYDSFLGLPHWKTSEPAVSLESCVCHRPSLANDTWDDKRLPPLGQRQRAHAIWVAALVDVLAGHLPHYHLPAGVGDDAAVSEHKHASRQRTNVWLRKPQTNPLVCLPFTCGWLHCRCWRWRRRPPSRRPAAWSPCSGRDTSLWTPGGWSFLLWHRTRWLGWLSVRKVDVKKSLWMI